MTWQIPQCPLAHQSLGKLQAQGGLHGNVFCTVAFTNSTLGSYSPQRSSQHKTHAPRAHLITSRTEKPISLRIVDVQRNLTFLLDNDMA